MPRAFPVAPFLALLLAAAPAASAGGTEPGASGQPPARQAATTGEAPDCAEALAGRVQSHYETVRDLQADFVQNTRSVAFAGGSGLDAAPARGRVHFAKPGRMRWEYREPEPSLVVSDGATLWIHDPVAKEVQVLPVGAGFLSGAAIQFLLGEGKLLGSFRVSARSCDAPATLVLHPLEPSTYERLELVVDVETGAIRETVVLDLFGNRTEVAFREVETNRDPPGELFRFDPPEGTRVLELPASP